MEDRPIRVLVIDDEYELHTRLRSDLQDVLLDFLATPEVTITTDITAAFKHFSKNEIHLIALDPENTAQPDDLISDLRFARSMPILILSGDFSARSRIHYMEQGADMVIPKPIEYREYLLAAGSLLKRYCFTATSQLDEVQLRRRYRELLLDPLRNIAEFDGETYELTKKEFEVLYLMAKHPGKILTKDYIFQSIWNTEFGDSYKSVSDIVYRLRKKLGSAFDDEYIENIYSTGYRFGRAVIKR